MGDAEVRFFSLKMAHVADTSIPVRSDDITTHATFSLHMSIEDMPSHALLALLVFYELFVLVDIKVASIISICWHCCCSFLGRHNCRC